MLATSEAELQELVKLPRPNQLQIQTTVLINVDKTKAMASDGIVCCILIQNEQLEQMNTFPYGTLMASVQPNILYQIKQTAGDRGITAENMKKSQRTDFNVIWAN